MPPAGVPARATLLSMALLGLMIAQAISGLLFPNQYRDADWIKATWFGNDWVTLAVASPLLLIGVASARRGSTRGLLVWLGTVGYALYNYAFYLFGAALNVFLLLYVAVDVLAVSTLIVALGSLDAASAARAFRASTPARLIGGTFVVIGVGLAAIWTGMWAAYVFAGRPTPVEPEAFKVVAALDLALMVPALVAGGVLLWRRRSWGYIVAAIAGVQGALYLLVLSVNSIVAIQRGLVAAPGELPIWLPLLAVTSAATIPLIAGAGTRWLPQD